MLKNYLLVALRNLKRNKTFSFINILGLALGMVCSVLIMLWVLDERSVDNFHDKGARLYSVHERQYYDNKKTAGNYTPGLLPEELIKVIPEIEMATGYAWADNTTFEAGEKILKVRGNHASPDFFKMFSFPLIEGNAKTALSSPLGIAISRKMATDFFGSPKAAMGKTMRYDNRKDFTVSAVFENLPANSIFRFNYLFNWEAFLTDNDWAKDWGNNGPSTFILLRADANPALVEKKLTHFLKKYNTEITEAFRIELGMQRFDEMYLHSNFKEDKITGGRIEYVRLFSLVAVFILLIACINFMNLTTARSVKRSKEIGVRKVVGAIRPVLIRQFIGEAILIAFFSVLLALVLLFLLLPVFNQLTGKQIVFPFRSVTFWVSLAGLTVVTGILSGSYPALFLSSFRPITVLKGTLKLSNGSAWFRKGLVVFQFALSIILIIGTIVVSQQVQYIQTKNLGYDRENLLFVPLEGDLLSKYKVFKEEALQLPGVKVMSRITQIPVQVDNSTGGIDWEGKDPAARPMFTQLGIGYDFIKTMNLQMVQGRDLSKDFASDSAGYILNETALKKTGYKDPIGKPFTFWQKKGTIIGIVKDFHFASLHAPILPLILHPAETGNWGQAMIRTEAGKTKETLADLEKLCKELNPKYPFSYQFADEEYQKLYKSEQIVHKLSNYFALLAIIISCLGLLGLAMFTAEQRVKEFGIRKVLGASIRSLFTLLSKDFLVLVLIAFVIAIPLAWWSMHAWLQDFEYRVNISWWAFAIAGIAALLIALCTISFQAIKAALANPVKSLRSE